jgi:hypothetical protein
MASSPSNSQLFLNFLEPCEVKDFLSDMHAASGYLYLMNRRNVFPSSFNLDQFATMKSIVPQDGQLYFHLINKFITVIF